MTDFPVLHRNLRELASVDRLRSLRPRSGADFASNDYLGLASSRILERAARHGLDSGIPIGSGGSRLLRGNHEEHERLEQAAADFFGSESALWFPTGYAANSAFFSTVPQRGDLIIHDELIHASVHEGLRLSRATAVAARHNDANHIADLADEYRRAGGTGTIWIAVESLYSMDGDFAPLADLAEIGQRYGGVLVVDEAHATGVFGAGGEGLAAPFRGIVPLVTLHTCGKALGCEGALLCADTVIKEFLINRARGFIFSTAPSPLMAYITRAALSAIQDGDHLRGELQTLIQHAGRQLTPHGAKFSGSQIAPLIIGDDAKAMSIAARLQDCGHDVRGIRPPTVPPGTSRLRISITRNISADDIARLAGDLRAALEDSDVQAPMSCA